MNVKKIFFIFVTGSVFLLVLPSKASAFKWDLCQNVYDKTWSCKDAGGVIGSSFDCSIVEYDTQTACQAQLVKVNAAAIEDAKPTAEQIKAQQAAAQAAQIEIQKQLQLEQEEIAKQDAEKKAIAAEAAKAAELVCDCTKSNNGQCRDDFNTTQEAVDYCNSCGIMNPQSSAVGCPLGSKETGPFSCTCGTGDKAVCSVYDTFYEFDKKCSPSCGRANGGCTVTVGNSLKALQKSASALNPAGFAFGSAGVTEIFGKIITFLMFPIGMFAMILYIWAGFLWMTAQGNRENVSKAKSILVWTTIGIIVTLASYMIVQLVFTQIL